MVFLLILFCKTGAHAAGMSCLVHRLVNGSWKPYIPTTGGEEFAIIYLSV